MNTQTNKNDDPISMVPIEEIIRDWNFYPRTEVSQETVSRLKEAISSETIIPPLVVDGKTMRLIDGFHRYEAYQGLKAETVPVEKRYYRSEKQMFEDAGKLNASHGRPFSSQDCRRFILLASNVGLSKEKIAEVLHVTKDRIESWTLQKASYKNEPVPIKRGLSSLVGKKLTASQKKLNEEWGGMNATFYVNQLLLFIQAGVLTDDDINFIERMDLLVTEWEKIKTKFN